MITRHDISEFLKGLLPEEGPITDEMLDKAIRESLDWFTAKYEEMDQEAKAHVDGAFNALFQFAGERIASMPDSPEKRKLHRVQQTGLNHHILMEPLLRQLELVPPDLSELAKEAESEILLAMQTCADFLFDIRGRSATGPRLICIGLLYGCLDECLAALHLARHHYYVQGNAHLRTILEIIDKVDLFSMEPQWVDVWTGDDFKLKRKELDPARVREKLGKDSYAPLYAHLSEHGTHATFRTFQARTFQSPPKFPSGRPVATIFVGGSPAEHLQVWFYLFATVIAGLLVTSIARFGGNALNPDEAMHRMEEHAARFLDIDRTRFIPWAESHNLDTSEMKQFLDALPFLNKGSADDLPGG